MMIEAHWKVLKRDHLYRFHRARLDMITWIIIDKMVPQQISKWNRSISSRREPLGWERQFVKEWNKHSRKTRNVEAEIQYSTDLINWICGCPGFKLNRFLLCKHLVLKDGRGVFAVSSKIIIRQSLPPFVQIRPIEIFRNNDAFRDSGNY